MFVKPATRPATDDAGSVIPGAPEVPLVVRFPNAPSRAARRSLRPEGEEVQEDMHWHRLLIAGDIVLAERPNEKVGELRTDGAVQEHTFTGDGPAVPLAANEGDPA